MVLSGLTRVVQADVQSSKKHLHLGRPWVSIFTKQMHPIWATCIISCVMLQLPYTCIYTHSHAQHFQFCELVSSQLIYLQLDVANNQVGQDETETFQTAQGYLDNLLMVGVKCIYIKKHVINNIVI